MFDSNFARSGFHTALAAAAVTLVLSTSALAQQKPLVIVGAVAKPNANPSASAVFGCEVRFYDPALNGGGLPCYGPAAMRAAYGVDSLLNHGLNGSGETIVILDAFGSPFAAADLSLFNSVFGLPSSSFTQITMPGTPPYDPTNDNIVGWTAEIALDTQWAHAMAPNASIVLVAAKSNDDQDLLDALNYALDNHLGSVVSMSFGESEADLANPSGLDLVNGWSKAFAKARRQHVTLFVSSGDSGSTNEGLPFQNVSWPASSPLVTGVGGTNLRFGTATKASPPPVGTYQSEMVWNDGFGAGGGGMSILMDEPGYQLQNLRPAVNKVLHRHRGVPDVAYNAGVVGGVVAAWSAPFGPGAFFIFGGTSAGAPQWSGIIADLNQARGRSLGFINRRLYRLGGAGRLSPLFHDITVGNNAFEGVPGFAATPGFDLATGWGTPNFGTLGAILADPDEDSDSDD